MTLNNLRLFPVFAEDDGLDIGGTGNTDTTDTVDSGSTETSGEEDLLAAIRELMADDDDSDEDNTDNQDDSDEDDDSDDEQTDDTTQDDQDSDESRGQKRTQSKEENAKFAAQRRQQELDDRVKAELERLKTESPEYLLAKQLSEMYGQTPEQMMAQIKEQQLQEEAKRTGNSVESLREREADRLRVTNLENELNLLRYQSWQSQIQADTAKLQNQYKMLTQEDFDKATDYILNVARNVNLPLEDAVYAVHGKKIIENLANAKVQNDLAKQSGRSKKTPPTPNNSAPTKVSELTAEERAIARAFNMTDEEYEKNKS